MMKYLLVLVIAMIATCNTMAFTSPSSSFVGNGMKYSQNPARQNRGSGSSLQMFFGQPKDDGSPGDYVCKDCGYVFTKGPEAWAKLPDNYGCPPCGAPKRRFDKVPKGSAR
mmetsp:Transcript_38069/g.56961  ORF Transcript_38069/g.56961 Transcript_38069/m.56961 type:complete len:111 (-) Transcript_38069:280-612(-)